MARHQPLDSAEQRGLAATGPQQAQQELQQYNRAWSTAEAMAYYAMLKDRFNVQIKVPRPKDALAE